MTATNGDRAEIVAKVWELGTKQGKSTREIARELGISQSAAVRALRDAEAAEGYIDLLDRAEARVAQALRLNEYMTWLRQRIEEGAKAEVVIPVAMKVEDRWAKLHGLDAPTRVAVTDDRAAGLDADNIAAVREAQRRAAQERNEVGAPPRGEGGG